MVKDASVHIQKSKSKAFGSALRKGVPDLKKTTRKGLFMDKKLKNRLKKRIM